MRVKQKQEIVALLQQNETNLKKMGVASIALFGSFVRDEATETSDVDVLVDFEEGKKNYNNFINLAYFLDELLGRKTELVTREGLSKYIGPKILQTIEYVPLTA